MAELCSCNITQWSTKGVTVYICLCHCRELEGLPSQWWLDLTAGLHWRGPLGKVKRPWAWLKKLSKKKNAVHGRLTMALHALFGGIKNQYHLTLGHEIFGHF